MTSNKNPECTNHHEQIQIYKALCCIELLLNCIQHLARSYFQGIHVPPKTVILYKAQAIYPWQYVYKNPQHLTE